MSEVVPAEDRPGALSSSRVRASEWQTRLYDYLTGHLHNESVVIDDYRALAASDTSPAFRYLAGWILEDERRHHQAFADIARSIRQMAEVSSDDSPIPSLHGLADDRERILELTEQFLKTERADARELKRLARRLRPVRRTSLWPLVVSLMQDDTAKHIKILTFVRRQAKAAKR